VLLPGAVEAVKNVHNLGNVAEARKLKICKNPLALAKTCGRLAPFLGFGIQIP
jgi:hypothetical protein